MLTFRSFFCGAGRYFATSTWSAVLAIPVAVCIVVASQFLAALLLPPLAGIDVDKLPGLRPGSGGAGATVLDASTHRALMLLLILAQGAVIALTLSTALKSNAAAVLKLTKPADGWITLVYGALGMVPLVAVFNLAATTIAPEQVAQDFEFFKQIAKSPAFHLTAIAVGLGASLSEELLFRGFLLSSLAGTRLGYWPAAAFATLGWTLLHLGYSWIGLAEVFLFGLYFSWLLWRTGSLWPPMFCHAAYNSGLLAFLRLWS